MQPQNKKGILDQLSSFGALNKTNVPVDMAKAFASGGLSAPSSGLSGAIFKSAPNPVTVNQSALPSTDSLIAQAKQQLGSYHASLLPQDTASNSKGGDPWGESSTSSKAPQQNVPQDTSMNQDQAPVQDNTANLYRDLYKLQQEKAKARATGNGILPIDNAAGFSPDQIRQQQGTADEYYDERINATKAAINKQEQGAKTSYGLDSALSGLSSQAANMVYKISDDFNSHPMVKLFNAAQTSLKKSEGVMEDIQKRGGKATAGDDMQLMYNFAKAQDPDSVVRESEYNNVGDYFSSLPQNLQFSFSRLYKASPDGKLTDESRKAIVSAIKNYYKDYSEQVDNLKVQTTSRIDQIAGREGTGDLFLNNYAAGYTEPVSNTSGSTNNNSSSVWTW